MWGVDKRTLFKGMKKHLDIFQGMVYYNQENDFQQGI